jgi:hypothetical protein
MSIMGLAWQIFVGVSVPGTENAKNAPKRRRFSAPSGLELFLDGVELLQMVERLPLLPRALTLRLKPRTLSGAGFKDHSRCVAVILQHLGWPGAVPEQVEPPVEVLLPVAPGRANRLRSEKFQKLNAQRKAPTTKRRPRPHLMQLGRDLEEIHVGVALVFHNLVDHLQDHRV